MDDFVPVRFFGLCEETEVLIVSQREHWENILNSTQNSGQKSPSGVSGGGERGVGGIEPGGQATVATCTKSEHYGKVSAHFALVVGAGQGLGGARGAGGLQCAALLGL